MPTYIYYCKQCDDTFEYYHTISEKKTECEVCKKETLLKLPHFGGIIKKQNQQKVGSIVENYIEETKEEIRREKDKLKNLEFKPE